jgi:hypothetical protein
MAVSHLRAGRRASDRVLGRRSSSRLRKVEDRKRRRAPDSTGWGQIVEEGSSPNGADPAMEGTSGAADRAPLRGGARDAALKGRHARAGRSGELGEGIQTRKPSATQATPASVATSSRQEVSEPIGLGRSSHRERSRRERPNRAKARGGPWPVTSRLAALGEGSRKRALDEERGHSQQRAAQAGDRRRGSRGSGGPRSLLADRFGCRSRRAARGPSRPRAKSLWERRWV